MKTIREHIKANRYKPVYLLYGSEAYLKRYYRKKLLEGALGDGDEMNVSVFSGKDIDWKEVKGLADTLPFFSERRVIVLEGTDAFKTSGDFADYLPQMPETTVLIFLEEDVDKRNRLYKAVKELGYPCELNGLPEKELKLWTAQLLKKDGKRIKEEDLLFFLERVGTDMENLATEAEKLVCYAYGREAVTREDILAVTAGQITGRIFQMTDAMAAKNQEQALRLYYDLLTLREKPMTVLYLMIRQFNLILQVTELAAGKKGADKADIAKKAGVPPFAVGKYLSQGTRFTRKQLIGAVSYGTELEERVKTGRLNDQLAVELFLVQYSK